MEKNKIKILIAGKNDLRDSDLHGFLQAQYNVEFSDLSQGTLQKLSSFQPKLLVLDMLEDSDLEILRQARKLLPDVQVLILTENKTLPSAMRAVREGAFSYLSKPVEKEDILESLYRAFQAQEMVNSVSYLAPRLPGEEGETFSSRSGQMNKIFKLISKVACVNTPVLLRGESGTGKEVMAKAIHFNSLRKEGKFVAINCSAIPENLIESELFGHEKGAFTGATSRKIGKFQYANGGTLFLDEIGDVSPAMQVKLLRVLQERKLIPVGSNIEVEVDIRIIAATNRNLEEMMQQGTFREDLFYRLSVLPIFLPPLRQRKEDVESLISHFFHQFSQTHNKKILGINKEALSILKEYAWPGNIRELRNVIEHAFVLETDHVITPRSLPERLIVSSPASSAHPDLPSSTSEAEVYESKELDFKLEKERFEKDFIVRALKKFKGRINQTSLQTNIPKKTLLRKIEKYKINTSDYRD